MVRVFFVLIFLSGCSSIGQEKMEPKGEFLASFFVVSPSFPGMDSYGFSYYTEKLGYPEHAILVGYRYLNGKVVEEFNLGSVSGEEILTELKKIKLSAFDLSAEDARVEAEFREDNPESIYVSGGRDTATWEFKIALPKGKVFSGTVETGHIEYMSQYSERYRSLNLYITKLATYYGLYHFDI